jgi:hypothetical protein
MLEAVSGRGGTGDKGFRRVKRLGLESRPGELSPDPPMAPARRAAETTNQVPF